ncbi:MAG: GNAT family N-acetyltransferase [Lachnospiraceae bacterium]|nr:GNAT family N-acetyltransferase [Lachnospiraceae bacterium]
MKIEHDILPHSTQRLEKILRKLDEELIPKLSERVSVKEYAAKLTVHAEIYYVVEHGEDIANAAVYMNEKGKGFISSFGVLPKYQRIGAGRILMRRILCDAKQKGIEELSLEVFDENERAVRFYYAQGFVAEGKKGKWLRMKYRTEIEKRKREKEQKENEKGEKMGKTVNLKRTAFCITQRCTLRCKLCLAFIPYYKDPKDVTREEAERVLDNYFQVVDVADVFTITGGEPLMNKDLVPILEKLYTYTPEQVKRVDFVTNGTLKIPEEVLDVFERNKEKTRIVLSDYGELSSKIDWVENQLTEREIPYRVSKFHGNDLYFDGWIDFTDHSRKIDTIEERDAMSQQCIHSVGKYFLINEGELHSCSRSYWRMRQGIIPKNPEEYVPLMDQAIPVEEKRETVRKMLIQKSSESCAHCVGLRNGVKRCYPAEQLP